jgi:hypothetical protein
MDNMCFKIHPLKVPRLKLLLCLDQFVVDASCLVIKHHHMYTHHHATRVAKGPKACHQARGFNDNGFGLDKYVKFFCIFIV